MTDRFIKFAVASSMTAHALLTAGCGFVLLLLIPQEEEVLRDFLGGRLPEAFKEVQRVSIFFRDYGLRILPLAMIAFWLDGKVFIALARRRGSKPAWIWSASIALVLIACLLLAWRGFTSIPFSTLGPSIPVTR
ncbi:MAG: hypothetical protein HY300_16590 [Verrucomicrobia bacterium]|nr:hypothetical protein [Verrucomicrobiota bacterium]